VAPGDRPTVLAVHQAAFGDEEGADIVRLVDALLADESTPPTLNLVAFNGPAVIGHVAFSPVAIAGADDLAAYILAPLGVDPEQQKSGVGAALVEQGMSRLASNSVDLVFVYGDPAYYGRFGFTADVAERFVAPHPLQFPFGWQARPLTDRGSNPAGGQVSCVPSLDDPLLW
jgi:putative acetyltransferase